MKRGMFDYEGSFYAENAGGPYTVNYGERFLVGQSISARHFAAIVGNYSQMGLGLYGKFLVIQFG